MRTHQVSEKSMAQEALDDHQGRADGGSEVHAGGNREDLLGLPRK